MADNKQNYNDTEITDKNEIQTNRFYGFVTNYRQRASENTIRIDFLDDLIKSNKYGLTYKRIAIGLVAATGLALVMGSYLVKDIARAKYIAIPTVLIAIGLLIILLQYMFVEQGTGSMLHRSMVYIDFLIRNRNEKKKFNKTHISTVEQSDGMITFDNGDVGYAYLVDGSVSKTAYAIEVNQLERHSRNYHNARDRRVTEFKITSSQRQTTEDQQKNLQKLYEASDHPAIRQLCKGQQDMLELVTRDKKSTLVQYLIVRAPSEMVLEEYCEQLEAKTIRNRLYYEIKRLDRAEVDRLFDFYAFN